MTNNKSKKVDPNNAINKSDEDFDETVDVIEDDVDLSEVDDTTDQYAEILLDPTKAVKIAPDNQDENEEILYCPNCGVTGLFVDNICLNCGTKKTRKSGSASEEADEDDLYQNDSPLNMDEF